MHLRRVILLSFLVFGFDAYVNAQDAPVQSTVDQDLEKELDSGITDAPVPVTPPDSVRSLEPEGKTKSQLFEGESKDETQKGPNSTSLGVFESSPITYPPDVEVEKSNVLVAKQQTCDCKFSYLTPYTERRSAIGFFISAGYSSYLPTYYKPDFVVNQSYIDFFGNSPKSSLIELTFGPKWNMALGSVAVEMGAGRFIAQGNFGDTLTLTPIHLGLTYTMDNIFKEPTVAPYATVGAYTTMYQETLAGQTVKGNTGVGVFWGGGVLLRLNDLDPIAAQNSYQEIGLENTFVFAEVRSFMSTGAVPDLSTDPQVGGGLKFEF